MSIELVNRWCTLSDHKLDLWQDPKNRDNEVENFKEHRHDQSIFSLLWKQAGLPVTSATSQWGIRFSNLRGACIPIHTMRNRTGNSRLTKLSKSNFAATFGLLINLLSEVKRKTLHRIQQVASSKSTTLNL